jgi:CheY-like chemotaxis protein/Tfp pilus assembly protein PilZ
MGYENIASVKNGTDALKLLNILMPDIILLDIAMPQMDGIATLRHIKSDESISNIPVIMISDTSDSETYEECKKIGCAGFLTKPIKVPELHDTLNKYITYPGDKKRKFLRSSLHDKVTVSHKGISEELHIFCISIGGVYVGKTNPYSVGTDVEVSLMVKDEKIINLKGTVIYVKDLNNAIYDLIPGMAIEFKDLTSDVSETLRAYVEELLIEEIIDEQVDPIILKDRSE